MPQHPVELDFIIFWVWLSLSLVTLILAALGFTWAVRNHQFSHPRRASRLALKRTCTSKKR